MAENVSKNNARHRSKYPRTSENRQDKYQDKSMIQKEVAMQTKSETPKWTLMWTRLPIFSCCGITQAPLITGTATSPHPQINPGKAEDQRTMN